MSYTPSLYDSDRRMREMEIEMEIERDRRRYASAYSATTGTFTASVVSETFDHIELEIRDSITGSRVRLYHILSKRYNSLLEPSTDQSSKTPNITLLLL